jgi:hypothetical protein
VEQVLGSMKDSDMQGIGPELMSWELARLRLPCESQLAMASSLLTLFGSIGAVGLRVLPTLLLEVAEAHHRMGNAEARRMALEAARGLRRGISPFSRYLPDSLVRCATLLDATDPAEAASLMHVARRWVLQALPHVPESARESFTSEVAVNRLLLSGQA